MPPTAPSSNSSHCPIERASSHRHRTSPPPTRCHLTTLRDRRIVAADLPLSTATDTKNKRYRITDSYLRFWPAFLERGIPLVERGRNDLALSRIERSWTSWRGRAVEPLVRASLLRLLPNQDWPDTEEIGGWWNRAKHTARDTTPEPCAEVRRALADVLGAIQARDDYDAGQDTGLGGTDDRHSA